MSLPMGEDQSAGLQCQGYNKKGHTGSVKLCKAVQHVDRGHGELPGNLGMPRSIVWIQLEVVFKYAGIEDN